MDDTDPIPTAAATGSPRAGSTSSTPAAGSPPADPVAALGERILAELGDPRTNSTLARWLAHHTARLIDDADRARDAGDLDADARVAEAREAILQLWQARSAWPHGWPPPGAAKVASILDDLPDLSDEGGWYRPTVPARLHDLHHHVLAALVDVATNDGEVALEQGWLDAFGDQLADDEATLLRRAAARPKRLDSLLGWWARRMATDPLDNAAAEVPETATPPPHPLVELADEYRDTVVDLLERALRAKEVTDNDDGSAAATAPEVVEIELDDE